MGQYFITITDYVPCNILDQRLQKEFVDKFRHMVIGEDDVKKIYKHFETVCAEYRKEGGRAKMFFSTSIADTNHIRYTIGSKQKTSMYVDLTLVRGDVEEYLL